MQAQPELFVGLTSGNVRNVVIKRKEMADGSTPHDSWGIAVHGRELTLFVLLKDKLSVAKVRMLKGILLNVIKLVKQNKIAVVN